MAEFSPNCLLQESEEQKDDTKDELQPRTRVAIISTF